MQYLLVSSNRLKSFLQYSVHNRPMTVSEWEMDPGSIPKNGWETLPRHTWMYVPFDIMDIFHVYVIGVRSFFVEVLCAHFPLSVALPPNLVKTIRCEGLIRFLSAYLYHEYLLLPWV